MDDHPSQRRRRMLSAALVVAVVVVALGGGVVLGVLDVPAWGVYLAALGISLADCLYWLRRRDRTQMAMGLVLVAIWVLLILCSLGAG